jgi:class 3 adenylate cyclase
MTLEPIERSPRVAIFADLAGFTALTEAHGDEAATRLLEDFYSTIRETSSYFQVHEVKTIGDAFLLSAEGATEAMAFALAAMQRINEKAKRLALRVGMHAGELIERDGDIYGRVVNLASRVMQEAREDEILVTSDVLRYGEAPKDVDVVKLGPRRLRGVRTPVDIFSLRPASAANWVTDPVCQMKVDPDTALTASVGRRSFCFCSQDCLDTFAVDPGAYVSLSLKAKMCPHVTVQRPAPI